MALPRPRAVSPTMLAWPILVPAALLLPFGSTQLSPSVSFVPALVSVVACFDVMSVYLLLGGYRDKGDLRLLMMAAAYGYSLVAMAGYALAFPGAVSHDPLLASSTSVAPYLYVAWHGGFPVLLGLASAPWPRRVPETISADRRTTVAVPTLLGAGGLALAIVTLVATDGPHLPSLIVGLDTSRMTTVTAPVVLPAVLAALVLSHLGTRCRTGPVSWCTVTIMVCACDLVLTYSSRHRFSLGWYGGRVLTLVAGGLVVVAMLASFRRLSARAEHNAAHDSLTGLANRRSVRESLDRLVAVAQRSSRPLGVVSLDLDHFKQINDEHGHAAGDRALATVADVLRRAGRTGDLAARVGGEEFLVVLPETDVHGTSEAAETLRRSVAATVLPGLPVTLTASLGVATLRPGDSTDSLLRRADEALYRAKAGGRDRVEVAAPASPQLAVVEPDGTAGRSRRHGRTGPGASPSGARVLSGRPS